LGAFNYLGTNDLQNIFFYVQQKKESQTGLEQHESEKMMMNFWMTYSFNERHQVYKPALFCMTDFGYTYYRKDSTLIFYSLKNFVALQTD